jgi:hypothetical protein
MPASVAAAAPVFVLPYSLASAFQQVRTYAVDQNRYPDGSVQSRVIPDSSRKRWVIGRKCTADELGDLRQFYIDRKGGAEEFYTYDPYETSPQFSYDETGVATQGRYAVRFDGNFQQSLGMGTHPAQFSLIEVS